MENQIKCPRCQSTQITANKKGFSGANAVAGAIAAGGIGLLAGTIGSNKVKITCLACGNVFNPGDKPYVKSDTYEESSRQVFIWMVVAIAIITTIAIVLKKWG